MLAGAPLLVAQLGALELRKWLMTGKSEVLKDLKLGTVMSIAAILKKFSQLPPITLLQLCYGGQEFKIADHLLQHSEDLDFVQDTLTATGNWAQLNPVMNSVLAGFNRRRRFNRFKYGNRTLDFDRIHFAYS